MTVVSGGFISVHLSVPLTLENRISQEFAWAQGWGSLWFHKTPFGLLNLTWRWGNFFKLSSKVQLDVLWTWFIGITRENFMTSGTNSGMTERNWWSKVKVAVTSDTKSLYTHFRSPDRPECVIWLVGGDILYNRDAVISVQPNNEVCGVATSQQRDSCLKTSLSQFHVFLSLFFRNASGLLLLKKL